MGILGFTLLAIIGVFYLGTRSKKVADEVASDEQVQLSVDETNHDWGEIDIDGGNVSHTFSIKNTGEGILKLHDVVTSCMCTTAQLKTADNSSRRFGMHEKSVTIFDVPPGETAELVVEFDPDYHGPSGVGSISRSVTMKTNDPDNPELAFRLVGNVVKK